MNAHVIACAARGSNRIMWTLSVFVGDAGARWRGVRQSKSVEKQRRTDPTTILHPSHPPGRRSQSTRLCNSSDAATTSWSLVEPAVTRSFSATDSHVKQTGRRRRVEETCSFALRPADGTVRSHYGSLGYERPRYGAFLGGRSMLSSMCWIFTPV